MGVGGCVMGAAVLGGVLGWLDWGGGGLAVGWRG